MRVYVLICVTVVLGIVSSTRGGTIPVTNFSFESPDVADLANTNGTATGWTATSGAGVFDPQNAWFPGTTGNNAPLAPPAQGGQVGFTNDASTVGVLTQAVGTVLQDDFYILTVAVGRDNNQAQFGAYDIQLLAGTTVIATAPLVIPALGAFADTTAVSPRFFAGNPLIGQSLSIRIAHADTQPFTTQTYYDNVRLESIPEPAGLAALAMGGLLMMRRRRSRR